MVCSYGILSFMRPGWTPVIVSLLLFVYGVGGGIFVPANVTAIMGCVGNEQQGSIGAVQRLVQNLGIALDTAVAAALMRVQSGPGLMNGFREAWGYAAITLLMSMVLLLSSGNTNSGEESDV